MPNRGDERGYGFYVRSSGSGARQTRESWMQQEPSTKCELRPCGKCGKQWFMPVKIFANNHWVDVKGPNVCGDCQGKVR